MILVQKHFKTYVYKGTVRSPWKVYAMKKLHMDLKIFLYQNKVIF